MMYRTTLIQQGETVWTADTIFKLQPNSTIRTPNGLYTVLSVRYVPNDKRFSWSPDQGQAEVEPTYDY